VYRERVGRGVILEWTTATDMSARCWLASSLGRYSSFSGEGGQWRCDGAAKHRGSKTATRTTQPDTGNLTAFLAEVQMHVAGADEGVCGLYL
jgi:hypothetical protein